MSVEAPEAVVVAADVESVWSPLQLPPVQPYEAFLLRRPAGAALLEGMRRMEVAVDCGDHCQIPDFAREGAYLLALSQGASMGDLGAMESAVSTDHFWQRHA